MTSLSYSRDGMNIAVASNDGNATNWRGVFHFCMLHLTGNLYSI